MGDAAVEVFESCELVLGHEAAVSEDGAGSEEVEVGVEVCFGGKLGKEVPRGGHFLLCFVEVGLDGESWVVLGDGAEALEEVGVAGDGEARGEDRLDEVGGGIDGADVGDAVRGDAEAFLDRGVAVGVGGVAGHVALADEGALAFFEADVGENLGRFAVD